MTNIDSILKSRDITLATKVYLVKAVVFPVIMYGCESWTIKKAEHQRIDAFELWHWRGLLRVPWTARISKQSILKESSLGCSLEGLMLKLKLQYFGYLMQRADSFEKILIWERLREGGKVDDRGWDGWMAPPTHGHEFEQALGVCNGQWSLVCCIPWGHSELARIEQLKWTEDSKDDRGWDGWHHWFNGHELGWTPGNGDRQGSLVCCSPWGCKESDTTEWLNWTKSLQVFEFQWTRV